MTRAEIKNKLKEVFQMVAYNGVNVDLIEESSNIIPDMRYAFNEGSKTLMAQVVDNGIIESK